MLRGIDISKWQGTIDFNLLKTGANFIIARCTYGVGYKDAQFDRNRDEMRKLGLPLGWYHYSYPQYNTPEAEADWFMETLGTPQDGEIVCLDFEESYADPVPWCLRFLNHVSSHLNGYKPLIYLNQSLVSNNDWKSVIDGNYGLWLAKWDYNADAPIPTTPWKTLAMRQWSNHEVFPGVSGAADADVFYGDNSAFYACRYHSVVQPPQNQDTEIALSLLREFKDANGFGNMEGTVRGLIGAFNDLKIVKDEYQNYKNGESERIKQAVDAALLENNKNWQIELDAANKKIEELTAGLAENLDWRTLFSIAWKKWWTFKRG